MGIAGTELAVTLPARKAVRPEWIAGGLELRHIGT
jgi:hypothetical protein